MWSSPQIFKLFTYLTKSSQFCPESFTGVKNVTVSFYWDRWILRYETLVGRLGECVYWNPPGTILTFYFYQPQLPQSRVANVKTVLVTFRPLVPDLRRRKKPTKMELKKLSLNRVVIILFTTMLNIRKVFPSHLIVDQDGSICTGVDILFNIIERVSW